MKPACLSPVCLYFGYDGLKRTCFHPESPKHLVSGKATCERHVADDMKLPPGMERPWPARLSLDEFRSVICK